MQTVVKNKVIHADDSATFVSCKDWSFIERELTDKFNSVSE
jgi:hypothetical protein